ncbi:MAG: lycopene cyclase domain-containing protein [Bacteroidota bacterium]
MIIFSLLYFLIDWSPIYSATVAMFVAGLAALWCRPDLKKKIWVSGVIFLLFYFLYFFILEVVSPGYVERVWALSAISGILIIGVPLEELMFAFSFGMLWSSYYEHLNWMKIKPKSNDH